MTDLLQTAREVRACQYHVRFANDRALDYARHCDDCLKRVLARLGEVAAGMTYSEQDANRIRQHFGVEGV